MNLWPPVRGPLFDFLAGDGLSFSFKIFSQNLQTLVTILIYKNFFGSLGYSASAYVMVGPERHQTLDLEPEFFSVERTPDLNDYASRRPSCLLESIERLYQSSFIFIPVLKAITHRESLVQRNRNGFESRTARVNLKEGMDEETSREGE